MENDTVIAVRMPAATKAALERAAKEDGRSVSTMVRRIVVEWLARKAGRKGGNANE